MRRPSRFDLEDAPDPAPRRQSHRCVCGTDLPGTCPGPVACPYSGLDDELAELLENINDKEESPCK